MDRIAAARGSFTCFWSDLLEPRPCNAISPETAVGKISTQSLLFLIIIMFVRIHLKAWCLSCFGKITVSAGSNQLPKDSQVSEPGYLGANYQS